MDIDRDACTAFVELDPGFDLELPAEHPFCKAEVARWAASARAGRLQFFCSPAGEPVGFAAMGFIDGLPILEQVSVRRAWMRRGVGRALLAQAKRWSAPHGELWLTTYVHVPWNQPWYEREGFTPVAAAAQPPGIASLLAEERQALPQGSRRVVMVFRHPPA